VFLREALGSLWGFLYGWTLFLVIQTGTIAAVSVAFAKFLGVFVPEISARSWIAGPLDLFGMTIGLNTQNLVAVLVVAALSAINIFGVKTGALVQNVFTFAKTAALLGLVLLGLTVGRNAEALAANFGDFWRHLTTQQLFPVQVGVEGETVMVGLLTILAVAQVGSLFAADAWNNVTFTAAEVQNPSRNLPLSLGLGTGIVLVLYITANLAYLSVLPLDGTQGAPTAVERGIKYAAEDRVGTAMLEASFGPAGAGLMALAIMISTFGCANGLILAGARVYYAMARDGLFFGGVSRLHPVYKTPAVSLAVQAVWTCVLCLSGSYGQLLDYIIFAVLVFYILTIVGLFVLRRTKPEAPRPYRALGYPVLPAVYIAMAAFIDLVLLRYKPQYTWPGLIIVLLGIPVYFLWALRRQGSWQKS
ncbi:MAG: amino acid permease, partial [Chloroflexi bacterium]|nr:amino acid permease [Chloroflexota bacterium]